MTLLGELPLDIRIREQADCGRPTVVADPGSAVAAAFHAIARRAAGRARGERDSRAQASCPNITDRGRADERSSRTGGSAAWRAHGMIEPFEPRPGARRSTGAGSSPTARRATATTCAARANSRSSPTSTRRSSTRRTSTRRSFVDFDGDVCIIPPNSFALARTVEYFRIPRNVLSICLGKIDLCALRHHRQRDAARARVGRPRDARVLEHDAAAGAGSTPTRASRR